MKTYNYQVTEDVLEIIEKAGNRSEDIRKARVITSEYLLAAIIESDKNVLGKYLMQNGYFDKGDNFSADLIEEYYCAKEFIETILSQKKETNSSKAKTMYSKEVDEIIRKAERIAKELKLEKANLNCIIYALMGTVNSIWAMLFPITETVSDGVTTSVSTFPIEMLEIFSKERLEDGTFGMFQMEETTSFTGKSATLDAIVTEKAEIPEALRKIQSNPQSENLILGRDDQIELTFDIMQKMLIRNVILVGREGTGKTAIVEGLAERIAKKQCPKELEQAEIFSLDVDVLMKNTKYLGQAEEKFDKIKKYLEKNKKAILFIDEIHNVIGMGRSSESTHDFANALKSILATGEVRVIGATTYYEYDKYLSKDPAFRRRFEKIEVEEPKNQELPKMLTSQVNRLEKYHGVQVSSEMLDEVIAQATAFDFLTANPSRTMNLLDIAMVKAKNQDKSKLDISSILSVHKPEIKKFYKMDQEMLRHTAIHETGHFIIAKELKSDYNIVTVVSIIPTQDYLGINCYERRKDAVTLEERKEYINEIAGSLAGDVATKLKGFKPSAGKRSDMESATSYAKRMILQFGLNNSENFGEYNSFTSDGEVQTQYLSEKQKNLLTEEINKILKEAEKVAKDILNENMNKLEIISEALMKQGILRKEQLDKLYDGTLKLDDLPEPEINLIL